MSFYNIKVDEAETIFNKYDRALDHTCYFCGGIATHTITRTSDMTDNTYCDHICRGCLKPLEEEAIASKPTE